MDTALRELARHVENRRIAVLTGAGCSTESGIPDYRGPETRRRARNPIQYRAFLDDETARRRYWARSVIGWPRIVAARPNLAHRALADLESRGLTTGLITQNVDRLHHAAGSENVVELHGALAEVRCMSCGSVSCRHALQRCLLKLNPGFSRALVEAAPDGDAELDGPAIASFVVVDCECGGALKPNVVFFGETVDKDIVDRAYSMVDDADVLLVVGSSLAVFSGYRFVRRAEVRGIPTVIVNLGESRGDRHAALRVDARAGEVLPALARLLD